MNSLPMERFERYYPMLVLLQIIVDFITLFSGFALGYFIWMILYPLHRNYQPFTVFMPFALLSCLILMMFLRHFKLYARQSGLLNVFEMIGIIKTFFLGVTTILAISFFYRKIEFSRLATIFSFAGSFILFNIERSLFKTIWRKFLAYEYLGKNVLIYGAGITGQRLAEKISKNPRLGYHVVGFVDDEIQKLKDTTNLNILGSSDDIEKLYQEKHCSYVFLAMPHLSTESTLKIIQKLQQAKIKYRIVPHTYDVYVEHIAIEDIDGIPLVGIKDKISRRLVIEKRIFDIFLAGISLILTLPLYLIFIYLIKKDSPGPAFFFQDRVGINGKLFKIYKFRTMYVDSPKYEWTPKDLNDDRITSFGKFLRRTSFDELPQLWNVLKGDMSFVGPRPEMPFIADQYNTMQKERLRIKPGITGLWQISGDRNKQIHENLEYDLFYIEHQSLLLDMVILLKTVLCILGLKGI